MMKKEEEEEEEGRNSSRLLIFTAISYSVDTQTQYRGSKVWYLRAALSDTIVKSQFKSVKTKSHLKSIFSVIQATCPVLSIPMWLVALPSDITERSQSTDLEHGLWVWVLACPVTAMSSGQVPSFPSASASPSAKWG